MQATIPRTPAMSTRLRKKRFARPHEDLIKLLLVLCGLTSLVAMVLILGVLLEGAYEFFAEIPITTFLGPGEWQPLFEPHQFSVWELVAGTMNVVIWSLVFAVPL